ncbi:Uncharacterised protein [Candidatus Burarchaeum australiense]|nr:Uncharacterised protein [Candidatus Burarchaeum australiense]
MKSLGLTAVIWKEGKHYVSLCPQIDVSSFGLTKAEAMENLKEAASLYLEAAKQLKLPLPAKASYKKLVLPLKLAQ